MSNVLDLLWGVCFVCCLLRIHCDEDGFAKTQCESGWLMFENKTCIGIKEDKRPYHSAKHVCKTEGGQLVTILSQAKQTFLEENLGFDNKYWIGLHRSYGSYQSFGWTVEDEWKLPEYQNWSPHGRLRGRDYEEKCVFISGADSKWHSTRECSEEHSYVCERNATCTEGRFGWDCDKFCHCHGETCHPIAGYCKYGCEMGWYGQNCDQKKLPAVVSFHCFNTTSHGPYILLSVDPRGVKYAAMDGLGRDGLPAHVCGIKTFTLDEDTGVYSRIVHIRDNQDNLCGGKKSGQSKYEWRFCLKERTGVMSDNDAIVDVKCDFSKADQLMTEGIQDIKGKVETEVKEVEETIEEVKLSVVDAFTNHDVKDVEIGASVRLRLQLLTKGSPVEGISGHSCEAFSSDHSNTKVLTDEYGCPVEGTVVSSMKQENKSTVTDFFPMFTFPGVSEVNFRCHYDYCFKPDPSCLNRCATKGSRRVKRSVESTETVRKPVYTTVRVSARARDQENENVDPPSDGHHGLPLLYLNPITCSMFLFLLTVFLLYYVFFIKSLKRSVEEMKTELRNHNRRGFADL